eukprot:scaffold21889_cov54-Phaeocystis_antarctica.AAC.2
MGWAMRIQDHGHVWAVDRDGTGESCIVGYPRSSPRRAGTQRRRGGQPLARHSGGCSPVTFRPTDD